MKRRGEEINKYPGNKVREAFAVLGRGVGQVMFQNNALSGFLMLLGLACGSCQVAALALLGNVVSTVTARVLRCDISDISAGLYGFNGTLVGIAVGVFFQLNVCTMLLLSVGAALSTVLFRYWPAHRVFVPLTAPFILVTWALLGFVKLWYPHVLATSAVAGVESKADIFGAFCHSFGQVMFQGNTIWAGLLFLIGILINSRRHAISAIVGAIVPLVMYVVGDSDFAVFNAGLWGYNAVLCAMVFSMDTRYRAVLCLLSIVLSVLFQFLGMHYSLITLTAPFVLATWVIKMIDAIFMNVAVR